MAKIIKRERTGNRTKTVSRTKVMKMELKDMNEETFYSAAYQLKFSKEEDSLLEKLGRLCLAAAAVLNEAKTMVEEAEANPLLTERPEILKLARMTKRDAIAAMRGAVDLQRACSKARTEKMGH